MYNTILVPVDLLERISAESALAQALQLLTEKGCIHVLRVLPGYQSAWVGSFFSEDAFAQALVQADQELQRFAADFFSDKSCQFRAFTVEGSATDEILATAEKIDADLIVMASHKRAGLERIVLGSVASKVAARAVMPVLIVKALNA